MLSDRLPRAGRALLLLALAAAPLRAQDPAELEKMSLDSLLQVKLQATSLDDQTRGKVSAASLYDQTAAEAPSSVTILSSTELRRLGYRSLNEVLAGVRGFTVASDRNYDYVGVRGFGRPTDYNSRVLLTINGQPVNEDFYGTAPIGTDLGLDIEALERIEIVRGPGSSVYGSNAMFAVVNLMTRSGRSLDAAEVHQEVGSFGARRTWGMAGGGLGRTGSFFLSGDLASTRGENFYFPEFDDPATNDGVANGLDGDRHRNIFAQATLGGLSVAGRMSYRDKHIPTGSWETIFGDPRTHGTDEWDMAQVSWSGRLQHALAASFRASWDRYRYRESDAYPVDEGGLAREGNDVHRVMVDGQLVWDLRPDNRLMVGGELRDHPKVTYFQLDESAVYFDGDFPFTTWSGFVQDEQQLGEAASLLVGLRYDRSSMGGGRATPRAALRLTPAGNTTVKLVYGEAFRDPSVYEQRYFGPTVVVADALRPEAVRTAELILEQGFGRRAWLTLSAFDSRVRDLIDTIELSDGSEQFANVGRATTRGFEGELLARAHAGHTLRLSYTYTQARDPDTDSELTNAPMHVARLTALAMLPRELSLATELRYETGRLTVQDSRTSPFFIQDVNLNADRLVGGLTAALRITNIFDRAFYVPGGYEHLQAAIIQPRRQLVLSVGYRAEARRAK